MDIQDENMCAYKPYVSYNLILFKYTCFNNNNKKVSVEKMQNRYTSRMRRYKEDVREGIKNQSKKYVDTFNYISKLRLYLLMHHITGKCIMHRNNGENLDKEKS